MPERESPKAILEIDRVVHEPARLLIMACLYVLESADFLFLMRQTGLTRGNLSSHIIKLESVDYVAVQKEFVDKTPRTLLRLTDSGRTALRAYRSRLMSFFDDWPG